MRSGWAARRVARMWIVFRTYGAGAFVRRVLDKARVRIGIASDKQAEFRARKAAADAAFDGIAGVDTGGIQHLYDLTILGQNARFGISHIASDPAEFDAAIAALGSDLGDTTFVDLGSGKGRALLMAAEHPFKRIVGVEFAAELHAVARANIAARKAAGLDVSRFELIHGDATEYSLPRTPIALFLFNPFDAPLIRKVAQAAIASWRRHPRPITILYVNPLHAGEWVATGWRETERTRTHAIFVPA